MKQLLEQRKGGNVKRFHTLNMHREHLVSSHSWGVAIIVIHIHPECSTRLLKAALWHDVPEYVTGDVSAVTKWDYPMLAKAVSKVEEAVIKDLGIGIDLMPFERDILKVADMTDLILCCLEEYSLGNQEAFVIAQRGMDYLNSKDYEATMVNDFVARLNIYVQTGN